jgi:hypothetical protein
MAWCMLEKVKSLSTYMEGGEIYDVFVRLDDPELSALLCCLLLDAM